MPTSIYETEILDLGDGTEIEMKPLKIAKLRKFMKSFAKLQDVAEDNDKSFDVLTECMAVALDQWSPNNANKAFIENNLTMNDYYRAFKVAAGVDMQAQGNL